MVKKGFLKKTGCILISASIILAGFTFFGSSTSDAGYDSGSYKDTTGNDTITNNQLDDYKDDLQYVTATGYLRVDDYGLDNYKKLKTVVVDGELSVGAYAFQGDSALTGINCGSMSGATGMAFDGCRNISFEIGSSSGGCYIYDGALYNGTTLVCVPKSAGRSITIKSGTTAIDTGAFNNSIVDEILFEKNAGANDIGSIGTQTGWPQTDLYVRAYGSDDVHASTVKNYFTALNDVAGKVYVLYDPGGSGGTTPTTPKYTYHIKYKLVDENGDPVLVNGSQMEGAIEDIEVEEGKKPSYSPSQTRAYGGMAYGLESGPDPAFETASSTSTSTYYYVYKATGETANTYTVNHVFLDQSTNLVFNHYPEEVSEGNKPTMPPNPYTYGGKTYDYVSGPDPAYVEASAATANKQYTYVYKEQSSSSGGGSSDSGSSSTTKKKYKVTVYDVFYDSAVTKVTKTTTRLTDTYEEGQTYNYEARTYTGYTWFDAEYQSGTVYSDRKVKFFYKATSDSKSSSSSSSSGTTKNKSGGNAGITASEKAQTTELYKITKGAGQTVGQNDGPVEITCNGELNKLLYILVDGAVLNSSNYTVKSGSTILTLTKEYIASLPTGDHAVQFQYDDGYALTGLRITGTKTTTTVTYKVSSDGSISSGHTKDTTPKTADGFDARYLLCLAIFLLGAGAILMGRQKNLEAILASQREDY